MNFANTIIELLNLAITLFNIQLFSYAYKTYLVGKFCSIICYFWYQILNYQGIAMKQRSMSISQNLNEPHFIITEEWFGERGLP